LAELRHVVKQQNHHQDQPRRVIGHGGSNPAAPRPPLVEGVDERGGRFDPVTNETSRGPTRRVDGEGGSTWRETKDGEGGSTWRETKDGEGGSTWRKTKDGEGRTYWFCAQTRAVSWADPHDPNAEQHAGA
jgi:hypothetical protein